MSNYYILTDDHKAVPADTMTWAMWFETADRHVGNDRVGEVRVSTVFLGLDHSFDDGPPLIFESMVFGGLLDQEQRRYSTWDEAATGHAALLAEVKQQLN